MSIVVMAIGGGSSHGVAAPTGGSSPAAITAATAAVAAQSAAWPYHLEFTHPAGEYAIYRLCVDGVCSSMWAYQIAPNVWRAPLPALAPGEHRLVVEACNFTGCRPGEPDLMVRVADGVRAGRRPQIDIVDGPRIPTRRP